MKILTLNTHSLAEENATEKMQLFSGIIEQEQPEIMAFQEVNQTMAEPFINEKEVSGYQPVNGHEGKMRRDNYGASLAEALRKKGLSYYWTWIPVKEGYDKYDIEWKYCYSVDDDKYGFSYSCLSEMPDGQVGIFYEKYDSWSRDELHLKNIMKFEKYTIDELKQEVK